MNYTVGAYSFNPGKKFKTNNEAVKHVQERYPHLSEDEIVKHLKPSINDESDKSTNASQENSESETGNSKAGPKSSERKPAGKD